MTAEDVYQDIKTALMSFGLSFHEKELVSVHIAGDHLVYSYEGQSLHIAMPTMHPTPRPMPIPENPTPL